MHLYCLADFKSVASVVARIESGQVPPRQPDE